MLAEVLEFPSQPPAVVVGEFAREVAEWRRLDVAEKEAVFAKGRWLSERKAEVGHGRWLPFLEALGVSKQTAARYMRVAERAANVPPVVHLECLPSEVSILEELFQLSDEDLAVAVALGEVTPSTTREQAEVIVSGLLPSQLVQQSLTNEWYTPAKYIEAARSVLGAIDLDPASCVKANETVGATKFFTQDDDGLAQVWAGNVWLNPPYGRLAGDFVQRLVDEFDAGNVTAAVVLVNAHCTDTNWFQPLFDGVLCFTDHRIDFAEGTEDRSGSTHGSVFAYFGPERDLFAKEFAQFGAIVERRRP